MKFLQDNWLLKEENVKDDLHNLSICNVVYCSMLSFGFTRVSNEECYPPQPSFSAFSHELTAPSHQPRKGLNASLTKKMSSPRNGRLAHFLMSFIVKLKPGFCACLQKKSHYFFWNKFCTQKLIDWAKTNLVFALIFALCYACSLTFNVSKISHLKISLSLITSIFLLSLIPTHWINVLTFR